MRVSVVRASQLSAFFASKSPVHRKETCERQFAGFIIISSTKVRAWGSSNPKVGCFCVSHYVEFQKEIALPEILFISQEKSASQNEKGLPI